ncbi:hypothetical protein BK798_04365 [Methanobrevibacter smithii]|uniref:Uncharacterized protein n=1 Tax=Methanobrevibacter smithii TaxID=2173 RepID=A0A2H4U6F7_METSM|nr:hypothetical protein BK798_04365 [Methanobrevibacter smithii]
MVILSTLVAIVYILCEYLVIFFLKINRCVKVYIIIKPAKNPSKKHWQCMFCAVKNRRVKKSTIFLVKLNSEFSYK